MKHTPVYILLPSRPQHRAHRLPLSSPAGPRSLGSSPSCHTTEPAPRFSLTTLLLSGHTGIVTVLVRTPCSPPPSLCSCCSLHLERSPFTSLPTNLLTIFSGSASIKAFLVLPSALIPPCFEPPKNFSFYGTAFALNSGHLWMPEFTYQMPSLVKTPRARQALQAHLLNQHLHGSFTDSKS